MRNSGNEPSSVILSQTKYKKCSFNSWTLSGVPKVPKQAVTKGVVYSKHSNLQFQSILTQKLWMLSKCYKSAEVDRRTWLHVPSGTNWPTSSDTHQIVEIKRDFYSDV